MKNLFPILSACIVLLAFACTKKNGPLPVATSSKIAVTSIYPAMGGYDTVVTITGQNFSAIAANDTVKFNGVTAVIQSATTNTIKAIVPVGAGTGPVTVSTANLGTAKGQVFTYNPIITTYFAGTDGPNAVYWKNGVEHNLPVSPNNANNSGPVLSYVYNMTINGTDVYITGYNGLDFVYWKNAEASKLPITAWSVAASGADVYFAGINQSVGTPNVPDPSVVIKNGSYNVLPTMGFAYTSAAAIAGNDVYFAGSDIVSTPGNNTTTPVYWKNGTEYTLKTLINPAYALVTTMAISGSDVYFAGTDGQTPVYWKNGVEHVLPTASNASGQVAATLLGMAISGNDIYFVGTDFRSAVYWKNGIESILPLSSKGSNSSNAAAIATIGTDVYIAGSEGSVDWGGTTATGSVIAEYWKNGVPNTLSLNNNYGGPVTMAIMSR